MTAIINLGGFVVHGPESRNPFPPSLLYPPLLLVSFLLFDCPLAELVLVAEVTGEEGRLAGMMVLVLRLAAESLQSVFARQELCLETMAVSFGVEWSVD